MYRKQGKPHCLRTRLRIASEKFKESKRYARGKPLSKWPQTNKESRTATVKAQTGYDNQIKNLIAAPSCIRAATNAIFNTHTGYS